MNSPRRDKILLTSIAKKLREIREARGVSQVDTLIDTDIHVARIEMGKTNVSISTLSDLCKYYGITLEEFFRGIEVSPAGEDDK